MSLINWLGNFLEKRNCDESKPDDRPLYAYRCTDDEFSEMHTLLIEAEKRISNGKFHLGYTLATENLFTLYCAEWWRRSYKGGVWKWDPIKETLGWSFCDWHTSADFVRKGLRYWKRDLISTGAGTQYLLSVASEGGIPINVLERDATAFKNYLKAIIREYGYYAQSGLSAAQISEENLFRLPASWRQPQIANLAGQLLRKFGTLKLKLETSLTLSTRLMQHTQNGLINSPWFSKEIKRSS